MRGFGVILPAVYACRLFGAEDLTGCLAAVKTAVAESAAGRWSESERELVGIIAEASDGNRLCLGIASGDLAVLLQRRGDVKGAERYARQSVAALETGGPEYEIALARPLQALAQAYLAEQRFAKAKEVLARLEHLPESSPRDRALRVGARAWIDANEGRWQDAERHYRAAIGEWEKAGEGDAVSVVPELSNLALLYLNQRRLAHAAPLFERAWRITDTSKEATDEQRVTVMTNLGVLYTKQRRWQVAAELLRRSLEIAETGTGVGADARRRLYETYALVLQRTGQKQEAKALQARADALLPPDTSSMTVDAGDSAGRGR
jgi:tetratricopeptide (TPR) repeat protein